MNIIDTNGTTALIILKSSPTGELDEEGNSKSNSEESYSFTSESNAILDALTGSFAEGGEYREKVLDKIDKLEKQYREEGLEYPPEQIKHNAIFQVIEENREEFPPEEFTISTELPDGEIIKNTVKAIVFYQGDIFKRELVEKQEKYDAEMLAIEEAAKVDPAKVRLEAMSKVVETLVLDGFNPTEEILEETEAVSALEKEKQDERQKDLQESLQEKLAQPFLEA